MKKELKQRSDELNSPIESIYFGGGSPSLLNSGAIENTIGLIHSLVEVTSNVEVTLEVNPDDVSSEYLEALKTAGVCSKKTGAFEGNIDITPFEFFRIPF